MKMSCKNCCFATYSEITQTGCSLGLIDKYRDNGVTIVEAYDEDKEFFVLEEKMCPFHRTEKWAIDKTGDLCEAVKEEVKVKLDFFIYVDASTQITDILNTIESLSKMDRKPYKAVVMLHKSTVKPSDMFDKLSDDFTYLGIPVQISAVLPKDISPEECLDHCVNTIESAWIGLTKAGCVVKPDFIAKMNQMLFEDMNEFVMFEATANNPVQIFQTYCFKYLGGSSECEMGPTPEDRISYKGISNKVRAFTELSKMIHLVGVLEWTH